MSDTSGETIVSVASLCLCTVIILTSIGLLFSNSQRLYCMLNPKSKSCTIDYEGIMKLTHPSGESKSSSLPFV